jgi:hypothetical protein
MIDVSKLLEKWLLFCLAICGLGAPSFGIWVVSALLGNVFDWEFGNRIAFVSSRATLLCLSSGIAIFVLLSWIGHRHEKTSRVSVCIPWYFKRGALTPITVPVFLFLVYSIAVSAFGALIQGLALLLASYAVFGIIGALIAISLGWLWVIMPPILYYALIKTLPGLWLRPDRSRRAKILYSLAVLILFSLGAYLVYHAVGWGIGWIADRNPCAAFSVGVTGSRPPVNCP